MKDKLPPIGQLGPFIALLIACAFFATQTERSSAARTSR
jgi:fructose transport system permease protein